MGTTTRPRNAEATKELLLQAAVDEFAEYGLSGARIDRIADKAGANKRLLYVYFGNKEELFDAVVERQVTRLNEEVPFDGADLPAHAAAVFDFMVAHPDVFRVVTWRDFERETATPLEDRVYARKLAAIRAAQKAGKTYDAIPAVDLLAMVQRLATAWLSASVGVKTASGKDPMSPQRLKQHRAAMIDAVTRVTAPR